MPGAFCHRRDSLRVALLTVALVATIAPAEAALRPTHPTGGADLAERQVSDHRLVATGKSRQSTPECGMALLEHCDSTLAPQSAFAKPQEEAREEPVRDPSRFAAIDLHDASGPCVERPWNDCGRIEEQRETSLPEAATVAREPAVAEIVNRMVRDYRLQQTPQSVLFPRSLGHHVGKGSIVILTAERRLLYFFQDSMAHEFAIGVARRGIQRFGQTRIVLKRRDPTWVPTTNQRRLYRNLPGSVGPGPKNPLGSRALNLTIPNIRIHGTNDDKSIGAAVSDGCFHMLNRDIEYLFEKVDVGTQVTILR